MRRGHNAGMYAARLAIIGYGKIAHDQHRPSIEQSDRFELAATADTKSDGAPGVQSFSDYREMLSAVGDLDAVTIATPASVRHDIARDCIDGGLHVLLEKPPGVTVGEVDDLAERAEQRQTTLFTTWHSQYNPAVAAAAKALAGKRIRSMRIVWHEDGRKWHPGQDWIWEPGGFGVFDPGINALAIASRIVDGSLFVHKAKVLAPANKAMPIAARLSLAGWPAAGELSADFDGREQGEERWTIEVESTDGTSLVLADGGARLTIDGTETVSEASREYPRIYARFAELIDARRSLVDTAPLRLVADAFLVGERVETDAV